MKRFLYSLLLLVSAANAGILSISPPPSSIFVGQSFTVDVSIDSVADLFAYQFDLSFDPAVLNATNVVEGPLLGVGGSTFFIPGTIDNVSGVVFATADSLQGFGPGIAGPGVLASFTFTAVGPGINSVIAIDPNTLFLLDSNLFLISAGASGAFATVAGAPEPSGLCFGVLGVACFVGLRGRSVRGRRG